jgi:hypothetical protein
MLAVLAKWGRPAAPPAPEAGEVEASWGHGFDLKRLADRLDELANYVTQGPDCIRHNFTMRVPAEPYHDADLVMGTAARLLRDGLAATLIQRPTAPAPAVVPVAVPGELRQIGDRLRNQDNRCTADPIFQVRGKERIYGLDSSASDEAVWKDDEWNTVEIPDDADPGEPPRGLTVVRYTTRWKVLMVAFTEEACQEHLRLNGHNYQIFDEIDIYVDSLNRCPEMITIREFLMALPAPQAGEGES